MDMKTKIQKLQKKVYCPRCKNVVKPVEISPVVVICPVCKWRLS